MIDMKVRAKENCFVDGNRRRPGDEFEFTPVVSKKNPKGLLPTYLEDAKVVKVEVEKPAESGLYADKDNGTLRGLLGEAGIKAPPQWKRENLINALEKLRTGEGE